MAWSVLRTLCYVEAFEDFGKMFVGNFQRNYELCLKTIQMQWRGESVNFVSLCVYADNHRNQEHGLLPFKGTIGKRV